MKNLYISTYFGSIFFITFVGIGAQNVFLEAIQEVQQKVEQLIDPSIRYEFSQEYNAFVEYFQEFNIKELYRNLQTEAHDNRSCHLCNKAIILGKPILKSPEVIKLWAKKFCTRADFYTYRVCTGYLNILSEHIVYIIQNTKLTSAEVCSVLLHPDCMRHLSQPMTTNVLWELPLPERKAFNPVTANLRPLKMLHLSDYHLDLWYTVGSNSLCNEPVCCRSTSYGNNRSAGFWSEYFCETPQTFMRTANRQIADRHQDIDFIIWTGDNVPHDIWNTSRETTLLHIRSVTESVNSSFRGIPVFPCLGNHDTHPSDFYVSSNVPKESNLTMDWLYDTLSDVYWSQWISTESAKETFKRGGYYSRLVNKGLKIIALNDGIADKRSHWIAHTSYDPDGQLQWLINQLDECETNGRYALIIGHYPPHNCYLSWANNYFRIAERYSHLIVGTFFGHTHTDQFVIYYNRNMRTNQTYPISLGFMAPSMTTYRFFNPGYKVFSLDKSGKPIDFSSYYTDILEDNKKGATVEPEWKLAYSAIESYGLHDMSVESWDQFITRVKTDDNLTEKYYNHYHRFSEAFIKEQNYSIQQKRHIILNQRVVNPIYGLIRNEN